MKYMVSMRQDNINMKSATDVDQVEAYSFFNAWCSEVERNEYPGLITINIKPMTQVHWDTILYNNGVKV